MPVFAISVASSRNGFLFSSQRSDRRCYRFAREIKVHQWKQNRKKVWNGKVVLLFPPSISDERERKAYKKFPTLLLYLPPMMTLNAWLDQCLPILKIRPSQKWNDRLGQVGRQSIIQFSFFLLLLATSCLVFPAFLPSAMLFYSRTISHFSTTKCFSVPLFV